MTESDSIPAGAAIGAPVGDSPPPAGPAAFKDRRVGLILFGIVQLLMALGCLGIAGLQLLMLFGGEALAPAGTGSTGLFASSAAVYILLAAGTVWLGIGSILCRRWARAVTLVLAWMGLVVGLMSTVFLVSVYQSLVAELRSQVAADEAGALFAIGCVFVAVTLLYILVPGTFVLFYRSPHVKATCEHYDSKKRWTDRLPLPVLAGGILLLSTAAAIFTPLMGMPLPFFGAVLSGVPAWIYAVVVGSLAALLARGFFRLERWAWLGTLLLMTFNGVSACLTFRGNGLARMYEAMNTPPEQLEAMESIGILTSLPWMMLVSILVMLGFYLWLGRYFVAGSSRS